VKSSQSLLVSFELKPKRDSLSNEQSGENGPSIRNNKVKMSRNLEFSMNTWRLLCMHIVKKEEC
jgi:hypothetical protein